MAPPFLPQAQIRAPRNMLLDFSPINNAIRENNRNAMLQQQFDADQEHRQSQLGIQREQLDMQRQRFSTEQQNEIKKRFGALAQVVDAEADPAKRAQMWQRITSMHPNAKGLDQSFLDPVQGPKLLMAEAGVYVDPLEREKTNADIDLKRAQAGYYRNRGAGGVDGTGKVSLQPIYGVDAEGNPVVMQPSDTGRMVRSQLPEGVTVSRTPIRMDAGTHHVLLDPITRQQIAIVPKDVAGAEAGKVQGKARGQAAVDLPGVEAMGRRITSQIEAVENDPNLSNVTGWQANLPTFFSSNVDTEERIAQLGGAAFLQAFESLKGGGQITEVEGQKATAALARLTNLRQSDAGFKKALEDFKSEVQVLVNIARQRAGGVPPPAGGADNDPLGIR